MFKNQVNQKKSEKPRLFHRTLVCPPKQGLRTLSSDGLKWRPHCSTDGWFAVPKTTVRFIFLNTVDVPLTVTTILQRHRSCFWSAAQEDCGCFKETQTSQSFFSPSCTWMMNVFRPFSQCCGDKSGYARLHFWHIWPWVKFEILQQSGKFTHPSYTVGFTTTYTPSTIGNMAWKGLDPSKHINTYVQALRQ